uniref:Uncharacterized protein n=1 Tax=Ciona savignyi TaxID=51511 RepID=H2ZEB7_CIOSA
MIDSDTYHMFEAVVLYHFKKRLQNLIISKFSVKLESSSFTELTKCFEELYHSLLWFKNYTHVWHDCDGLTKKIKDQVKAMLQWTISHHMKNQFTKMIAYVFQFHLNREDVATDDITFEWEGQFE